MRKHNWCKLFWGILNYAHIKRSGVKFFFYSTIYSQFVGEIFFTLHDTKLWPYLLTDYQREICYGNLVRMKISVMIYLINKIKSGMQHDKNTYPPLAGYFRCLSQRGCATKGISFQHLFYSLKEYLVEKMEYLYGASREPITS